MVKIISLIFAFSGFWNNVSGLFLDSMLDKCHGLPFCEQLQPILGRSESKTRPTSVNTLSAQSGRIQDVVTEQKTSGYDPFDGRQSKRPLYNDNDIRPPPQRPVGSNTVNSQEAILDNYITKHREQGHVTSGQTNGRQSFITNPYSSHDRPRAPSTLSKQQQLLELLEILDHGGSIQLESDRPQQHQQPARSYVMDKYNGNTHQQQLLQSQGQISQIIDSNRGRSRVSSRPVGGGSSPYGGVGGGQGWRMDPSASSRSPFQMMSGNNGQGPSGPFTIHTSGGNGGSQMSPFSTAQRDNTINTPGQMFSSVMNSGNTMFLGPAAGMGNHGGAAMTSNFFGSQNKPKTDTSVVFGDTDQVQYVDGKIVIPKSWALNHLAKAIQQQEQLQGKSTGEGTFGCPEFPTKCPKKYTFLDNNGCPICTYMPQEVKRTEIPRPVSRPDVCNKPPESKGPCGTFEQRYAFDIRVKRCRMYVQNACGDLKNKFGTEEECQYVCGKHIEVSDKETSWYDKIWNK